MAERYTPRLRKLYDDAIVKAMTEKFGYTNRMQVPRLEKIVLNMGVGEATQDRKKVETAAAEMTATPARRRSSPRRRSRSRSSSCARACRSAAR